MSKTDYLFDVITKQKMGRAKGICSICTANEIVIEAAMEKVLEDDSYLLIESTCNQVNQDGGYTGMKPADFRTFIYDIAARKSFPQKKIILGGDHLGPNPWKKENAVVAMEKAGRLIEEYVLAGYIKIHIDTSMFMADDPGDRTKPLDSNLIATRGAELALRAEEAYKKLKKVSPDAEPPVYVIGTEVPVPGGTGGGEHEIDITKPADLHETVQMFKKHFFDRNLEEAWKRVIAVVVQPGVEFGTGYIIDYNRDAARKLSLSLAKYPDIVFEAHSTDYQSYSSLKKMVKDGFCILKVGPALTFTLRESLFSLAYIENELSNIHKIEPSQLINVLDKTMVQKSSDWQDYYYGTEEEQKFQRKFSLSDRSRYYWALPEVKKALSKLIGNLQSIDIPVNLISQFMPVQYSKIRTDKLDKDPLALVKDKIKDVLDNYTSAI